MFRAFYIEEFDTLIINMHKKEALEWNTVGDICKLTRGDALVGYNIKNWSTHFKDMESGLVKDEVVMLEKVNELLKDSNEKEIDYLPKQKFVVGFVESKEKHPDSDRLSICMVNIETEILQIVCGAKNVDASQKVPVALVGATMPSGMLIKEGVLRGVESNGMICSQSELGIPNAPTEKGIWVMEDTRVVGEGVFNG